MTKSFIWPLFNRVIHVFLILFFGITFLLGDIDRFLDYHVIFGILFFVLFFYRFIWGFIGPKYSKFKDFVFDKKLLKEYLLSPFSKTKEYSGHNPASSVAIVLMIILTILCVITGMLAYGIEENHGIFSFLHNNYFKSIDFFKDIHEFFVNGLLVIIAVHILGVLIDKFMKKGDALDSMISGYKSLKENESIKLHIFQKIFILLSLVSFIYIVYYMFYFKDNIFIVSANEKQDYSLLHQDFVNECGSCHIAYPPFLLPEKSWVSMMATLENHFGDDASIDSQTNASIFSFLKNNSAETSNQKSAWKILKSLKDNNSTIAITQTPYWKKKHRKIDKELFASKEVKSKANCKACHQDIEYGLIEKNLVKKL